MPRPKHLSVEQQAMLCTAFLALPGMRVTSSRTLYIDALNSQLGGGLSFTRHADPLHDVWALLRACQDYPDAIGKLVAIVRAFHRDSRPLAELEVLVDCLFSEQLLEAAERAELLDLLPEVAPAQAMAAHRLAVSGGVLTDAPDWTDPESVLADVEAYPAPAGSVPPLLTFVDYLAHQQDAAASARIHRWIDAVAVRLRLASEAVRGLCVAAEARLSRTQRGFLLVLLRSDGVDRSRYLTSVWLQRDGDPDEPLLHSDQPRTLPEIVDEVHGLLRRVPEEFGIDSAELTLEFILPRALITHPVDQWQVDRILPYRLGTGHRVVLRSLDRLRSRELHGSWRRRWRWLVRHGHQPNPDAIHWLDVAGGRRPEALRASLLLDDRPVALAMAFAPGASPTVIADELTVALYTGVPVMVWCRDGRPPERFRRERTELMAGRGLVELPEAVRRLRLRAEDGSADDPPHLGRHLTLLWDDADRMPEIYRAPNRLAAP
ncbi:MAG TPA: hypothetical protein VGD43_11565 [Micromonospora sp.]